jgi:tetratricopeptide (TPR) repeat protein
MPRDLEADLETLRSVLALAERRDIAGAAAIAERALSSGFEHPMLLNVLATRLEEEGKLDEALRLLERAVQLAPTDVGVLNALTICLQRLDRPAEALGYSDRLLKLQPNLAFAHANRGNALISIGALAKAHCSHSRALELDPDLLASKAALASIASHRGDHGEARRWAREVLARLPGFPDAVLSLAAAELATGATDTAQLLTCQLLADPRAGPAERARANGLLGDVLDASGRHAEAFGAYTACNDALRNIHRQFAAGTSILTYSESVLSAMQRVDAARWQAREDAGNDTDEASGHVFLLGFFRSGTTLLEVALEGHPRIASLEEHELLAPGVLTFMREPLDFEPLLRSHETVQALRLDYWRQVREAGVEVKGRVFVDKHPLNTLKLPLIARLFPRARILFAYRDPRDVVLSCFRRRFNINPATYQLLTLEGASALYDITMRVADHARGVLGLRWHDVCYEKLVDDFAGQLRAICQFLEIEWAPEIVDFATRARARERATPSTPQLAKGLSRSGMRQWKNYQTELAVVMPALQSWAARLGYDGSPEP